jgi:peptidoglycan/xylan/chitin deacetylase (PgdA/CDA1 family)
MATRRAVVDLVERFVRRSARSQGPADRPRVALTFDDGPHPDWTPKVLDALDRACARATFFVVGRCVEAHPDLVVETRRRGHEIGTHLYSHERGTVFDDQRFNDELARSRDQLESLLGEKLRWLRFPYGERGRQDPRAIKRAHGIDTAHWTYSSHDGKLGDPDAIVARVAAGLRPGAILLLHDALADEKTLPAPYVAARDATLVALSRIGELLGARALTSVTLSQLFGES